MKQLIISITLSFTLSLFAYFKKAMTTNALILAFLLSCIITYFGGISSFFILASVFLGSSLGSKLKHRKQDNVTLKNGKKDIYQIIANVGLATLVIFIYGLTNRFIFLLVYAWLLYKSPSPR
ncbi:MAG: DUF92 domain-containing protein, partial [Bacilli bacterium]|nr:DUF92 domain-containing protein [Bacilli bacterium]